MNYTYIREMVDALAEKKGIVTLSDDRFVLDKEVARQVLEEYWADYALSVFDSQQVIEVAAQHAVPLTQEDVRAILHELEEGVVSIDYEAIEEAICDYAHRVNWYDPERKVDYEAYNLPTCDWLIVLDRCGRPDHELPGWTTLSRDTAVQVVSNIYPVQGHSLAYAIRQAKAHDDAEREFYPDEVRHYSIYAVESFNPAKEDALEELRSIRRGTLLFSSEYDFFEGFGKTADN